MYSALIAYPRNQKRKGLPYYFAPGHPDRLEEERRATRRARRARKTARKPAQPHARPRSAEQPNLF